MLFVQFWFFFIIQFQLFVYSIQTLIGTSKELFIVVVFTLTAILIYLGFDLVHFETTSFCVILKKSFCVITSSLFNFLWFSSVNFLCMFWCELDNTVPFEILYQFFYFILFWLFCQINSLFWICIYCLFILNF